MAARESGDPGAAIGDSPWWTHPLLARLPAGYRTVRYVSTRFPDSPAVTARPGVAEGANCQLFAYEVLKHFGLDPPLMRSSELWEDVESTARIVLARPLDLVLFNATSESWGAHVGVHLGEDHVLHLCAEVGFPDVWRMSDFIARERYRILIGTKRVLRRTTRGGP